MALPVVAIAAKRHAPRLIGIGVTLALLLAVAMAAATMVIVGGSAHQATAAAQCEGSMTAGLQVSDVEVPDLDAEQSANAAVIVAVAQEVGAGEYGAVIGVATAFQESTLLNVDHGDAAGPDSIGLFQQRDPWGSRSDRMDPAKAAEMFFTGGQGGQSGLLDVAGWQSMTLGEAAQAVQRSADPSGAWYARHEAMARNIVSKIGGVSEVPAVSIDAAGTLLVDAATTTASLTGAADLCGPGAAMNCPPTPWPGIEQGLTPDALRVLRCAHQAFPQVETFLGVGERSANPNSDHPTGRAVDAMIPDYKSAGASASGAVFRVSTYNVLGDSHTRPGGKRSGWADARTRMGWQVDAINNAGLDVVGFQEFQPAQLDAFMSMTGGQWGMSKGDKDNRVAWRRSAFDVVTERALTIPYFYGNKRQMPYVLLQHRASGQRVWVLSAHNPADVRGNAAHWRAEAVRREAALANELMQDGTPVIFAGDMNDRETYLCDTVKQTALHSASGGSAGILSGPCQTPKPQPVDWLMGSPTVNFSGYQADQSLLGKASDHPMVYATASIGAATGQALGDQMAAWVTANAKALGVNYVIWDAKSWSVEEPTWKPYSHPSGVTDDTSLHRDHVHVSVFGNTAGATTATSGPWTTPLQPGTYTLTSPFGYRVHPVYGYRKLHTGMDYSASAGTPILAASSGTVTFAGQGGAYGNLTKVDHGGGVETWYAHQSSFSAQPSQVVEPGQVIGFVGTTGVSTGDHLHFEVRLNGVPIDPEPFLLQQGVTL